MVNCRFQLKHNTKKVIWEITNYCNYGCRYCISASGKKHEAMLLTTQDCFNIVDNLIAQKFTDMKITGGEPFSRTDILPILEYIDKSNIKFDISTNASYITNEIATSLALLKNMKFIHVSIDGYNKAQHEAVRGLNTFEPTMNGLATLIQHKIPIRIGCVIHQQNENDIAKLVCMLEELGISNLALSMMEPIGRLSKNNKLLASIPNNILIDRINSLNTNIKITHNLGNNQTYTVLTCPAGENIIHINANGETNACPWFNSSDTQINKRICQADKIRI